MARKKKNIVKVGFVLPYSIWDGLKSQPADIIREAIDICVEYDRHWLEDNESTTAARLQKSNPAAAVVFSFARPLIDANNRRYYERLQPHRAGRAPSAGEAINDSKEIARSSRAMTERESRAMTGKGKPGDDSERSAGGTGGGLSEADEQGDIDDSIPY